MTIITVKLQVIPCPIYVGHYYHYVQNLHLLACFLHAAVSALDVKLSRAVVHYRGFLCT